MGCYNGVFLIALVVSWSGGYLAPRLNYPACQQGDFLADAMADELRAKLREMAKQVAELQV
jgi:hypothetical protein